MCIEYFFKNIENNFKFKEIIIPKPGDKFSRIVEYYSSETKVKYGIYAVYYDCEIINVWKNSVKNGEFIIFNFESYKSKSDIFSTNYKEIDVDLDEVDLII